MSIKWLNNLLFFIFNLMVIGVLNAQFRHTDAIFENENFILQKKYGTDINKIISISPRNLQINASKIDLDTIKFNFKVELWIGPNGKIISRKVILSSGKSIDETYYNYDSFNILKSIVRIKTKSGTIRNELDTNTRIILTDRGDLHNDFNEYENDILLQEIKFEFRKDSVIRIVNRDGKKYTFVSARDSNITSHYKIKYGNEYWGNFYWFAKDGIAFNRNKLNTSLVIKTGSRRKNIYNFGNNREGVYEGLSIEEEIYDKKGRLVKVIEGDIEPFTNEYIYKKDLLIEFIRKDNKGKVIERHILKYQ